MLTALHKLIKIHTRPVTILEHPFLAMIALVLRIRITLIRIRILLVTLHGVIPIRIHILPFTFDADPSFQIKAQTTVKMYKKMSLF
jgi:hypothetical protein